MSTKNLLLEVGTEEIPSRFLPDALRNIVRYAEEKLSEARISFEAASSYATPRRLVLNIRGVAEKQNDLVETFKGPAWKTAFDGNGMPTKAAEGFARSKGVSVEDLQMKEVGGVEYAVAVVSEEGCSTSDLLPSMMPEIIGKLVFPKNMYWADPTLKFARPIRWLLCLWGSEVVPFSIGSLESGRITRGHRFMGTKSIEIDNESEYMDKLYDNYVIVDQEKRKEKMMSGISRIEKEIGGFIDRDPDLIDENLYLVEYPIPFYGSFDTRYLDIPEEVLITTMKHHQKYFPVRDGSGKLLPYFVGVSNNRATSMEIVREGNERVLRARLEDAAFFWEEDQRKPLAARVEELKNIVYQEKLGSVYDKVMNTQKLAMWLCGQLGLGDIEKLVERAVYLSKADLVTNMVCEFAELQGVMGREYALKNGEPERVARGIFEQYLPKFAGDSLPSDSVGAILSLAERILNIVNCFKVGFQPTGSQDPYGLRRAARCVNEIIWGLSIDIDIDKLLMETASVVEAPASILDEIRSFIRQRLQMQLKEKGYSHELVALAISVAGQRPLQVLRLVDVFSKVLEEKWFKDLVVAAVRVRNILAKADEISDVVDVSLFREEAEGVLFEEMKKIAPQVKTDVEGFHWNELMSLLAELSPSITRFFDDVMVMDKDDSVRLNRLALLSQCNRLFKEVGDLGVLKG